MDAFDITQNMQNDQSRPSRRRISSILKAPRTPLRTVNADKDEGQEEQTQFIEKKRKSRRVSFATTNDIKYIRELNVPAETDQQQGAGSQYESTSGTEDRCQEIIGMDTLLNAPLHILHKNKEYTNFHLDGPDITEKTVMFSEEDTALMDMTHCHTIVIDNDMEEVSMADQGQQNFASTDEMQKRSSFQYLWRGDAEIYKNPSASGTAQIEESDMNDFLASLSQTHKDSSPVKCSKLSGPLSTLPTQVSDHSSTFPKVDTNRFLSRLKARTSGVDKENQTPLATNLVQNESMNSLSSQRHGLQFINKTSSAEKDNVNLAKSHMVTKKGRDTGFQKLDDGGIGLPRNQINMIGFDHLPKAVSQFSTSESDDMDMTKSQTVIIDSQMSRVINPLNNMARNTLMPFNKTILFSEDEYGMDITDTHKMPKEDLTYHSVKPHDMGNTTSCQSHCQNVADDPDDMEMTRSQTTVIDSNKCIINPLATPGRTHTNKTVIFSESDDMDLTTTMASAKNVGMQIHQGASPVHSTVNFGPDDMEITQCHSTVADVNKCMIVNAKQYSTGKNAPVVNRLSDDDSEMEMTTAITAPIEHLCATVDKDQTIKRTSGMEVTKRTSCPSMMTCASSYLGNMENQPVFNNQSFGINKNRRNSLAFMPASNKTILSSGDDCDMEMTSAVTVTIEETPLCCTKEGNAPTRFFPAVNQQHRSSVGRTCQVPMSSEPDDMEMTRSQTVVIDSESCGVGIPLIGRSSLVNKTILTGDDCGMEMTTPLNTAIEENTKSFSIIKPVCFITQSDCDRKSSGQPSSLLAAGSNDIEIKRSQADVTDSKKSENLLFSSGNESSTDIPCNKTVLFSKDDYGMEITSALNIPIENSSMVHNNKADVFSEMQPVSSSQIDKGKKPISYLPPEDNGSVDKMRTGQTWGVLGVPQTKSGSADFNISRSQTADSRNSSVVAAPPLGMQRKSLSNIQLSSKVILFSTELNDTQRTTRAIIPNEQQDLRSRDLTSAHLEKTRNLSFDSSKPVPQCSNDISSGNDCEMEMTKVLTVSIERDHHDQMEECAGFSTTSSHAGGQLSLNRSASKNVAEGSVSLGEKLAINTETMVAASQNTQDAICIPNSKGTVSPYCNTLTSRERGCTVQNREPSQKEADPACTTRKNCRRLSVVDIQSTLQDIKRMIVEPPEIANTSHTAPFAEILEDPYGTEDVFLNCLPAEDLENNQYGLKNALDSAANSREHSHSFVNQKQANLTAPVNFVKSKPRALRMTFGGILPKLPQINKPTKKVDLTISSNFELQKNSAERDTLQQISSLAYENIEDETLCEINSEEDLSENIECQLHTDRCDQEDSFKGCVPPTVVCDSVFLKPYENATQGLKRSAPVDGHEDTVPVERKKSPSSKCDNGTSDLTKENLPTMRITALDSANYSNISACTRTEATFETSAQRCSQYEDDFDETKFILRKKLEDGSITVTEFLKLCDIYIVIHKPRQSVLPDNFAITHKPEDFLIEKHIYKPRQRVYEEDSQELSKMVEILKLQKLEQDKPLKAVNEAFWEVVKTYSEEKMQQLRVKLRDRKAFFTKTSKAVAHEMKVSLYTNLVHTTQVAQENLKSKITDADDLLRSLDDCLQDLKSELDSVKTIEETTANSELALMLKNAQQELHQLNTAFAESERCICELELEKKSIQGKIKKVQEETSELQNHVTALDRLTEWRLCEKTEDKAVFTFLHGSLQLEVLFKTPSREATLTNTKIASIKFHQLLNEEISQCHARLVHALIEQYIHSETDWVEKYPTKEHMPLLLHNVSLVVGRCRALGEEIHRLRRWGSLRLDILNITCEDMRVKILFSSMKAFAKFEVTLAVTPAYPAIQLQMVNFQNFIGNTRVGQLEEVVSSVSPDKNYLTRVIKKIHNSVLC